MLSRSFTVGPMRIGSTMLLKAYQSRLIELNIGFSAAHTAYPFSVGLYVMSLISINARMFKQFAHRLTETRDLWF